VSKPILIDLYCCAGGATKGYQRAGFYVIGVDRDPQPNYCGDAFVQMDALEFLATLAFWGGFSIEGVQDVRLADIAAFHGSPPCQAHTALTKGNRERGWEDEHVDLIPETRDFFEWFGLPYVIENVQGAPLRRDLTLCGEMFGLAVIRHRYFELGGWSVPQPEHIEHRGRVAGMRHGEWFEGPYFAVYGDGGGKGSLEQWEQAMGIDWVKKGDIKTRRRTIAEAIPPAYAAFVGTGLMYRLLSKRAAA
jgi:hypothetical protein